MPVLISCPDPWLKKKHNNRLWFFICCTALLFVSKQYLLKFLLDALTDSRLPVVFFTCCLDSMICLKTVPVEICFGCRIFRQYLLWFLFEAPTLDFPVTWSGKWVSYSFFSFHTVTMMIIEKNIFFKSSFFGFEYRWNQIPLNTP